MSGHHPPNILEQGVRGVGLPPEEPMETQMPTQTTFSVPMGHTHPHSNSLTTITCKHPWCKHTKWDNMHPWGIMPHTQSHTCPPGMQAGPSSDEEEYQLSPTLRLGTGNKRLRQEDTLGGHQHFQTTQWQNHQPHIQFNDNIFNTQIPETTANRINNTLEQRKGLINGASPEDISQSPKDRILALSNCYKSSPPENCEKCKHLVAGS